MKQKWVSRACWIVFGISALVLVFNIAHPDKSKTEPGPKAVTKGDHSPAVVIGGTGHVVAIGDGAIAAGVINIVVTNSDTEVFSARLTYNLATTNQPSGSDFITSGGFTIASRYPVPRMNMKISAPTIKEVTVYRTNAGTGANLTKQKGYCISTIESAYCSYLFEITSSAPEKFAFEFWSE